MTESLTISSTNDLAVLNGVATQGVSLRELQNTIGAIASDKSIKDNYTSEISPDLLKMVFHLINEIAIIGKNANHLSSKLHLSNEKVLETKGALELRVKAFNGEQIVLGSLITNQQKSAQALQAAQEEANRLEKIVNKSKESASEIEKTLTKIQVQIPSLKQTANESKEESNKANAHLKEAQALVSKEQQAYNKAKDLVAKLEKSAAEARQKVPMPGQTLQQFSANKEGIAKKQVDKAELQKAQKQLTDVEAAASKAKEEAGKTEEELQKAQKQLTVVEAAASKAKKEADEAEKELQKAQKQLTDVQTAANKAKGEADKAEKELRGVQSRIPGLKEAARKAKEEADKGREAFKKAESLKNAKTGEHRQNMFQNIENYQELDKIKSLYQEKVKKLGDVLKKGQELSSQGHKRA